MAWASNHHGIKKASVLHQTAACVDMLRHASRIKPQSVSNILYAMAEARYRDDGALEILTAWACRHVDRFNDQERANLAWACARLNCSRGELFRALRPHVCAYAVKSEAWLKEIHHTGACLHCIYTPC